MQKLKIYGSLFMAMLSVFTVGGYTTSTIKFNEPVELYRWILTGLFGLMFLLKFLIEYEKK